jgi:hypothetical protein
MMRRCCVARLQVAASRQNPKSRSKALAAAMHEREGCVVEDGVGGGSRNGAISGCNVELPQRIWSARHDATAGYDGGSNVDANGVNS